MSDDDYAVGYRKPPKDKQFKKGQSGNPKGRRKGARGIKSDLKEELNSTLTINENGKTTKLTKQRLLIKRLFAQGAKGDIRAVIKILEMAAALQSSEEENTAQQSTLSEEDEAILNAFLARQMEQNNDR